MSTQIGHPATSQGSAPADTITNLPTTLSNLSAQAIRDMDLQAVDALLRFEARAKSELATLSAMIQAGLTMRFEDAAKGQLMAQGKDTGTSHIFENGFDVAVEIGKTVKWDQGKLAEITRRIAENGGDPEEYVDIKYSISEAKFKAWPENLRRPFEAARTVKPGKPKITLRQEKEER